MLNTNLQFVDSCSTMPFAPKVIAAGVNNMVQNTTVKVYPNPASTVLNVELQVLPDQNTNICLFNNLGELVVCNSLKYNLTTINTANLPSGMYYYRVTDTNGTQLRADKVVIIH